MMNQIKRFAGILWILTSLAALYFLITTAVSEIERKPLLDTKIQWGVFIVVFLPIAFGMMVFGYFAWKGEYDHLPESSREIDD